MSYSKPDMPDMLGGRISQQNPLPGFDDLSTLPQHAVNPEQLLLGQQELEQLHALLAQQTKAWEDSQQTNDSRTELENDTEKSRRKRKYQQQALKKALRAKERRFGRIDETRDVDDILTQHEAQGHEAGQQSKIKKHPLLGDKARFSGIAPSLNADPQANSMAENDYAKRHQLTPQPAFNPKPTQTTPA